MAMFGIGLACLSFRDYWKFALASLAVSAWLIIDVPGMAGLSKTVTLTTTLIFYLLALALTSFGKVQKAGRMAISTSRIDKEEGTVFFRGEEIPARSHEPIRPDTPVYVKADHGTVLIVEACKEEDINPAYAGKE